jgi:TPP-dependent pyruvate/acetoin dehydrogenase alpha subunit
MQVKTKEQLIEFENEIVRLWEDAKIPYPVHFSGGNEEQLIKIFKKIKKTDFIFTTHRAHYHYLLKGGSPKKLKKIILEGKSMHIFDKKLNFFTSAIVAGCCAIAVGTAFALKRKKSKKHVWIFCGDGCCDEGHWFEAYRYAVCNKLPITFVIENNDRSVETSIESRWGKNIGFVEQYRKYIIDYSYKPRFPHVGTQNWVDFGKRKVGGNSF